MSCTLTFPARSDIGCVAALREDWLARTEQQTNIQIDCAAVETMSAAAAQLVLSLAKGLAAVGGCVKLMHVSEGLREDFTLLGLKEFI